MRTKRQVCIDNISFKEKKKEAVDLATAKRRLENAGNGSVLFSKGRISKTFFTEDSKLYITPREQKLIDEGAKLDRRERKWDSLSSRVVREYQQYRPSKTDALYRLLEEKCSKLGSDFEDASRSFLGQFGMVRLWNMSIVGAILVGMFSMSMIYRYLGQGASAGVVAASPVAVETGAAQQPAFAGAEEEAADLASGDLSQKDFEEKVRSMVKGYPIEKMVPYILEKDRQTAAFLVAIAKKESAWGKHSPVLKGQDCYNYWGYRGQRKLMGSGGHTCFNSRKDAVDTVARRLDSLVNGQELDTPAELIVWKCGSSCAGHGAYNVQKWIDDVDMYYRKLK